MEMPYWSCKADVETHLPVAGRASGAHGPGLVALDAAGTARQAAVAGSLQLVRVFCHECAERSRSDQAGGRSIGGRGRRWRWASGWEQDIAGEEEVSDMNKRSAREEGEGCVCVCARVCVMCARCGAELIRRRSGMWVSNPGRFVGFREARRGGRPADRSIATDEQRAPGRRQPAEYDQVAARTHARSLARTPACLAACVAQGGLEGRREERVGKGEGEGEVGRGMSWWWWWLVGGGGGEGREEHDCSLLSASASSSSSSSSSTVSASESPRSHVQGPGAAQRTNSSCWSRAEC